MTIDRLMAEINSTKDNGVIQKLLENNCNMITVIAPHLDDNLRPVFELQDRGSCPRKLDCQCCSDCEHFVCVEAPHGIFAFMAYTGYCIKDE